jgi:hypothetical protein
MKRDTKKVTKPNRAQNTLKRGGKLPNTEYIPPEIPAEGEDFQEASDRQFATSQRRSKLHR